MNKFSARVFFCTGPAVVYGLPAALLSGSAAVGCIVAVAVFFFGLHITRDDTKEGRSNG